MPDPVTMVVRVLTSFDLGAVSRAGIKPEDVEEVYFGNVLSAG